MRNLKTFEQIWQEKLLNASISPREKVWEAIALQINEQQQRRKKAIAWWIAATIALFLGDGTLIYRTQSVINKWWGKVLLTTTSHVNQEKQEKLSSNYATKKSLKKKNTNSHNSNSIAATLQDNNLSSNAQILESTLIEKKDNIAPKKEDSLNKDLAEEKLGKPKAKRWWIQRSLQAGIFKQQWHYASTFIQTGRMLVTPQEQILLKREENLLKEINTYKTLCTWGAGIETGFQINKNWFITAGLLWRKNYARFQSDAPVPILAKYFGNVPNLDVDNPPTSHILSSPTIETVDQELVLTTNFATSTPTNEITYTHTTESINVPIKLGYQIQKNKWRYALCTGIETNFLISSTFSSKIATYSSVFQKVNRIQKSGLVELQVGYQVTPLLYVQVSPSFRSVLTPLFKESTSLKLQNQQIWLLGLGMQWRL